MRSIYEAKETRLSKDFELVGKSLNTDVARKYLKQLDNRMNELGLTYDQCRDAARLFKTGYFEKALKTIWGSRKVKTSTLHTGDGSTEVYVYEVDGYATFREKFQRSSTSYIHTITATYNDNPNPSKSLGTVIEVVLKANTYDFEGMQERANRDAFKGRSTAAIYNILFTCMDGYDMSSALSKYHLKLRNKL